jgi:hypothetical protein
MSVFRRKNLAKGEASEKEFKRGPPEGGHDTKTGSGAFEDNH